MLTLPLTKSLKSFSYPIVTQNTANLKSRHNSRFTIVKNAPPEHIAKLSKKVQDDLAKIHSSRNYHNTIERELGTHFEYLKPKTIYNHAINMFESENPRVKDWGLCLLFQAAEKGNLEALNKLGSLIVKQSPELNQYKYDQKTGIQFLKESLKHGSAEAAKRLGDHYLKGEGVKQNVEKAEAYYMDAHAKMYENAFDYVLFARELLDTDNPKKYALIRSLVPNNSRE